MPSFFLQTTGTRGHRYRAVLFFGSVSLGTLPSVTDGHQNAADHDSISGYGCCSRCETAFFTLEQSVSIDFTVELIQTGNYNNVTCGIELHIFLGRSCVQLNVFNFSLCNSKSTVRGTANTPTPELKHLGLLREENRTICSAISCP